MSEPSEPEKTVKMLFGIGLVYKCCIHDIVVGDDDITALKKAVKLLNGKEIAVKAKNMCLLLEFDVFEKDVPNIPFGENLLPLKLQVPSNLIEGRTTCNLNVMVSYRVRGFSVQEIKRLSRQEDGSVLGCDCNESDCLFTA